MAIYKDGKATYEGQVLGTHSRFWLDGMEDEYAVVWDMEEHCKRHIQIGYYGSDGRNLMGNAYCKVDYTEEVRRDILRTLKKNALNAFAKSVTKYKKEVRAGSHVVVSRGRKIPKGTELTVFWVGERETYRSRQYNWMNETESIAGCHTDSGEKVWIKTEYLTVTDKLKSPNRHEREKFVKDYVERNRREYGV